MYHKLTNRQFDSQFVRQFEGQVDYIKKGQKWKLAMFYPFANSSNEEICGVFPHWKDEFQLPGLCQHHDHTVI